jgi:maltose alpha-D-glucosyltransferase/alpha-amylase
MSPDDASPLAARIAAALPAARWFAGKEAAIEGVTVHDRIDPQPIGRAGPQPAVVLADVRLAGRAAEHRYCLVVDPSGDDVAGDPTAIRWLVETILAAARLPGMTGGVVGHRVAGPPAAWPVAAWPAAATITPVGVDASNSSFIVQAAGAGLIVKLFRRCRTGIQPEVEIGEFLAAAPDWHGSPRLLGWLEHVAADGESAALATVHEFAPDCTTAWDRLVGLLVAAGPNAALPAGVAAFAARIGTTTGRMHAALAARPDVPAFAPETPTVAGRRAMAERMAAHAAEVFTLAESRLPHVAPPVADRLRRLLESRTDLRSRFAPLGALAMDAPNIRVHGDYHLGQVLLGAHDDRVLVVDFEGEPGRAVEERRAKASAAKDVAGMCRSFDYLLRHVAAITGGRHRAADLRRLEAAFLDAYRTAAAGGAWWPADSAVAAELLDLHRRDKAIYELAYEIANRPDWVEVPLAALEELAATPAPSRA